MSSVFFFPCSAVVIRAAFHSSRLPPTPLCASFQFRSRCCLLCLMSINPVSSSDWLLLSSMGLRRPEVKRRDLIWFTALRVQPTVAWLHVVGEHVEKKARYRVRWGGQRQTEGDRQTEEARGLQATQLPPPNKGTSSDLILLARPHFQELPTPPKIAAAGHQAFSTRASGRLSVQGTTPSDPDLPYQCFLTGHRVTTQV